MTDQRPIPGEIPSDATVPKVVVNRLSLYLRELQRLESAGQATISSGQLGALLGFSDAQVRKDLGFFGQFGYPGVGYRCDELIRAMRDILGTNQLWPVVMVGVGNLGQALLGYRGFVRQNFRIVAAFDADPAKVGQSFDGITVRPMGELPAFVREQAVRLGMIVVPTEHAQAVAEQLVAAGVDGIVNFAPVTLTLPPGVQVVAVDLAIELEQLSFAVTSRLQTDSDSESATHADGASPADDSEPETEPPA
ncbi:redox-sensing transcriptional repressor Rex [bacterium]|jgi:redox-sensing transcriptional repressor|nr:redox-sensing transcriptional repressor Rex [Pirellulales bacterium]NBP80229.1 redox-sensing transcriptional repressor Rex [bacterium]